MSKYRAVVRNGGYEGYWKVQEKVWFWWITRAEFSIWSDGILKAKEKALETIRLLEEN